MISLRKVVSSKVKLEVFEVSKEVSNSSISSMLCNVMYEGAKL